MSEIVEVMSRSFLEIADFVWAIETCEPLPEIRSFVPFCRDYAKGEGAPDFTVRQVCTPVSREGYRELGGYDWFESRCYLLQKGDHFLWNRVDVFTGELEQLSWEGYAPRFFGMFSSLRGHVMEHLLLIAFNYGVLPYNTLVLHSSVVECEGKGYLFLGESGTGKSTHTRLWLQHIPQSELLNDDAPIIRIVKGEAWVYGTPWSGKGGVYRDRDVPIGGIYRLSQAPSNVLTRLDKRRAFAALLHSTLPPLLKVEGHSDRAFEVLSELIVCTEQFHLACLPDREAAVLAWSKGDSVDF